MLDEVHSFYQVVTGRKYRLVLVIVIAIKGTSALLMDIIAMTRCFPTQWGFVPLFTYNVADQKLSFCLQFSHEPGI